MSEFVRVSEADGVMEIRLHRPDRKNALTHEMYSAMTAAFSAAEQTP